MSRRLLASSSAVANSPTNTAANHTTGSPIRQGLDVVGANGGHQSEEDEHEELAQTRVAVGARATGVEPAGGQAGRPHHEDPPRRGPGQAEADHSGHAEAGQRGALDGPGRGQARRHQANGADPLVVGPADAVRVVVGIVGPHLDGQGDDQGGKGPPPHADRRSRLQRGDAGPTGEPVERMGGCRTDQHRHDGGRQRPRPCAQHPTLDRSGCHRRGRDGAVGRHGRRGKRPKSGGRCSWNALRPSWPSSLM